MADAVDDEAVRSGSEPPSDDEREEGADEEGAGDIIDDNDDEGGKSDASGSGDDSSDDDDRGKRRKREDSVDEEDLELIAENRVRTTAARTPNVAGGARSARDRCHVLVMPPSRCFRPPRMSIWSCFSTP